MHVFFIYTYCHLLYYEFIGTRILLYLSNISFLFLGIFVKRSINAGFKVSPPSSTSSINQNISKYKCDKCTKYYQYKHNLWRHLRYECGKEPQFQCLFCPKMCKIKTNLTQHMRLKHYQLLNTMY